jgi:hypothetical protein
MAYSAGNLEMSITALSTNAINSLDAVISKLGIMEAHIKRISSINMGKLTKGLDGISPVIDKINSSSAGLKNAADAINKINNASSGKGGGNRNGLFHIGKLTAVYFMARRIGGAVADIVQSGADYTETLNLWTVAMNGYEQKATEFVNKMNEAYGISEKTLMNAQATFKNMLGALGGLSSEMAYGMSEGITKMALDYASLYNVSIEQAMTKFQAALAGQVRPIRSISGYDITESTLGELYKSMGGTKTIRQLSQTEKRLLSIYAIFNQMGKSGAAGDMKATIDSFANQSRVMAEQWQDVKSFAGAIITENLENLGILKSINTALAFTAEFLKGIATLSGALDLDREVESWADSLNNANTELDEVQKKLLGFDKFRALDNEEAKDNQGGDIGIDETISKAIGGYGSALDLALLNSKQIAREWLKIVGLTFDEKKGTYEITERFEAIKSIIDVIGSALIGVATVLGAKGIMGIVGKLGSKFGGIGKSIKGVFGSPTLIAIMAIVGALYYLYTTNEDFRNSVNQLFTALTSLLGSAITPLSTVLGALGTAIAAIINLLAPVLTFIIDIVTQIIQGIEKIHLLDGALWLIIGAIGLIASTLAVIHIVSWIKNISSLIPIMKSLGSSIAGVTTSTNMLWIGLGVLVAGIASLAGAWDDMSGWHKALTIIGAITAAIIGVVVAMKALSLGLPVALGIGAALAGGILLISSQFKTAEKFANGGMPDKGTMFVAGEAGAEMVYNMPSGQSGVANIQQIAQATYQGTMSALRDWWGGQNARGDIPQLTEANATGMYQAVTGVANSYGKTWSNV